MVRNHILVPLDGSPLSEAALVHALDTFDCRVTVLNVVTPLDASMSESGILMTGEDREREARSRADDAIQSAQERASEAGRTVDTAVEAGDPAETIVEYAEDNEVDQVVMGGHGGDASDLTKRLLGTVSTAVTREAPVTVTVVR